MIVTIDTNVLVSAAAFGGVPRSILERAAGDAFTLALSQPILSELYDVLCRPKLKLTSEQILSFYGEVTRIAWVVIPSKEHLIVEADPTDNTIIDCAVEASAQHIVSGDRYLLELSPVVGVEVRTPADFQSYLDRP